MVQETDSMSYAGELFKALLLAVVIASVIRLFLFEPFYIPSESMEPTLYPLDRVIVNKVSTHFQSPVRGDILVFKFPMDPSRDLIKRVIGLEGEIVEIRQNSVYINGRRLVEAYLPHELIPDFGPETIPRGHLFMMGDNRNNSDDSRVWGPLDKSLIIGKALLIYWPYSRIELLH